MTLYFLCFRWISTPILYNVRQP